MNRQDIASLVLSVLKDVQETSGREWTNLDANTTAIGTLDGFDSLAGMEATALIEEKLRAEAGLDSLGDDSLFAANNRALTLDEVCHKISAALPAAHE